MNKSWFENMYEEKEKLDKEFDKWLGEDKKELCENCRQYRVLTKRDFDGLMLCKKCYKNTSLKMFKTSHKKTNQSSLTNEQKDLNS